MRVGEQTRSNATAEHVSTATPALPQSEAPQTIDARPATAARRPAPRTTPSRPNTEQLLRTIAAGHGRLTPDERRYVADVLASPTFVSLPDAMQRAVIGELTARPEAAVDLAAFIADPGFTALADGEQQRLYENFAAVALATGARVGTAARLAARREVRAREPNRIAVVFPGQRADVGRGEMSDALRRTEQMRRLFPDASIDLVIFDPPESAMTAYGGDIRERPNRAVTYLHEQLGWNEPWDYRRQPTIERNGIRLVYATAPANPQAPFRERYGYRVFDAQGDRSVPRATSGIFGGMHPTPDSLGAQVVSRADVAIVAGAGQGHDARLWHLNDPFGPRARLNMHVYEPDVRRHPVGGVSQVHTTLSDRGLRDYDAALTDRLRQRVAEMTPRTGDGGITLPRRESVLTDIGLDQQTSSSIARTHWATAYAHVMSVDDAAQLHRWADGVRISAAARREPFTAFVVVRPNATPDEIKALGKALAPLGGPKLFRPPTPGRPRILDVDGGNRIVITAPVSQDRYRSLVAGTSLVNHVTGTNSLADVIAAGKPFTYETLSDVQGNKIYHMIEAAMPRLRAAGFSEPDIAAFVAGMMPVNLASSIETPIGRSAEALYAKPDKLAAMYSALSHAIAVDDSSVLRDQIRTQLESLASNPATRLLARSLATGDTAALLDDPEFKQWLEVTIPAERRAAMTDALKHGAPSLGIALVSAFAGHGLANGSDLSSGTRALTEIGVGTAVQASSEVSWAMLTREGTSGLASLGAKGLLAQSLAGFPRQAFVGTVLAATLSKLGMQPDGYALQGSVVTGTIASELSLRSLTSYLELSGNSAALRGARIAVRGSGVAGAVMLADWAAGVAWDLVDDDAEYAKEVGLLALKLGAEQNGVSALATTGAALLPTSAAALGRAGASTKSLDAARELIRDGARAAETAMLARIAAALQRVRTEGREPYAELDQALAGEGARDLVKLMQLARGPTRTGFSSALVDVYRGRSATPEPDKLAALVNSALPGLATKRASETRRDLARALLHAELAAIVRKGVSAEAIAREPFRALAGASGPALELLTIADLDTAGLHAMAAAQLPPEQLQQRIESATRRLMFYSTLHEVTSRMPRLGPPPEVELEMPTPII